MKYMKDSSTSSTVPEVNEAVICAAGNDRIVSLTVIPRQVKYQISLSAEFPNQLYFGHFTALDLVLLL